ncbi:MAG TPA: hypothetical protein VFX92_02605 [Candidatus Krumholzibacteria bacterium]|nr:hypothetical protein [Candidatus Krumholzibacteria bacterium]
MIAIAVLWLLPCIAPGSVQPPLTDARDVIVEQAQAGDVQLTLKVTPATSQLPGAELTYTMDYKNTGAGPIANLIIADNVPAGTEFKVNSASIGSPPGSVASIALEYSDDGGASWTYAPTSGGGGAPPSFDSNVTHVRFVMTGKLHPGVVPQVGVGFTVRIRD